MEKGEVFISEKDGITFIRASEIRCSCAEISAGGEQMYRQFTGVLSLPNEAARLALPAYEQIAPRSFSAAEASISSSADPAASRMKSTPPSEIRRNVSVSGSCAVLTTPSAPTASPTASGLARRAAMYARAPAILEKKHMLSPTAPAPSTATR